MTLEIQGVQVVVSGGFIQEVRCPPDWWVGGACGRCQGTGYDRRDLRLGSDCPDCHDTGRTPGHGTAVVARHPVTKVVVTDREPHETGVSLGGDAYGWLWWRENEIDEVTERQLPSEVFAKLIGGELGHYTDVAGDTSEEECIPYRSYPTREAAVEALSRALVDLARDKAGLPPINWEEVSR